MATVTLGKGVTDLGTLSSLDTQDLLIGEGSQVVTTGLDQSGLATGIASIFVQKGSAVGMKGVTGAFLKAAVTGAITLKGQGGEWYYTPTGTGCARIRNISGMRLFLGAGGAVAVTRLENANNASTSIDDSTIVTNLYLIGGAVDALYKSTVFTLAQVNGGMLSSGRGFTTLNIGGNGQVIVKREDTTPGTPPVATTVTLNGPGAKLKWCGGNITTLNVWGGATVDMSDVPAACTVGTLNIDAASLSASVTRGRNFLITYTTENFFGADADARYA